MASLRGQLARIFAVLALLTAIAAFSAVPGRSAPFAAHVMDARSGETIYAHNADTRLHPASLTKMLTLYITFDAIRRGEVTLDTMVTVSANAAGKPPSKLGLRTGQRIALRHLIRAAAVKSANDAASAIGDHLSGNEAAFARRMDRTAKALGMGSSTFKNANGLTAAGHLSTARDMSVLGRRLFYDFPEYYNLFSRRTADAGVAQVANTNSRFLSNYRGADGIKTGYTVAAGFNLTASAEQGSKRLIATVFGGTSTAQRNAKVAELLDMGFAAAPANVAVRKPAPARIPAPDAPAPAATSEMVVADGGRLQTQGNGEGRASAKTIRLVTSVARSPRPRPRPDGADAAATATAVLAMQDTIAAAVAVATAQPEAPLPFAVVGADGLPAAPSVGAAQTETVQAEASRADTTLPFALAGAAPGTASEAAPDSVSPLAPTAISAPPRPRPAELVLADAPEAAANPGRDLAEADLDTGDLPFQMVEAEDDPVPMEAAPTGIATLSAPAQVFAALPAIPAPPPVMALRPAPRAETAAPAGEPVVITRISTSGGRHWGVTLGRFASRAAAERALMKTALSEGAVLGEGLRKISSGAKGFDANILGLTQDQADLACRRMQARAQTCLTLSP
ncbi:MAG: serine hydrolase [Gemmobacter sp.]